MRSFAVRARRPDGSAAAFTRAAETRDALLAALRSEGLLVLSVTEEAPARAPRRRIGSLAAFEVETGLRQLASMVRGGVTLITALTTVSEQSERARTGRAWADVARAVSEGSTFSDALAADGRFGGVAVRLAAVGEQSGELALALTRAADQLESRRELKTAVVNALAYPFVAVTMAIGVSAYLVTAVIPKIADFLAAGGAELPAMTQALMDFSAWARAYAPEALVVCAAVVAAWFAVRASAKGREREDALLLRIPVAGRILRLSGTALFARSMQILTESGVTLLDALATGAELMSNRRFRRRVAEARECVLGGATLAESLAPAVEFMPMLARMAAVGETSGALPESFGETARFHETMLALAVKRFGMVIEPVMIVVTALIVGFVYVAFFLALFSMADVG